MTNALTIVRSLIIYSLCLPLAIFLGYLLAMPMDTLSFTIVVAATCLPLVPLILKHHHFLLFACWNMSVVLFFLPGKPNLGMVMIFLSFMLSIMQHVLNRNIRFISVPSVTRPLVLLIIVVLLTAKLTGGFGARFMGSESYGAKRYFTLLAGIVGYFAMTFFRIPREKALLYVSVYLLGAATLAVGNLAPYVSSTFYPIFAFFPVESLSFVQGLTPGDESLGLRKGGTATTATALVLLILARHGIRGLFDFTEKWHLLPARFRGGFRINNPWRLILLVALVWISLATGGYRSTLIMLALTFLVQFHVEGLARTHLLPVLVLVATLVMAIGLPLVSRMPANVQRALSLLPVEIDPTIRYGAESTLEWRLDIWKRVLPTVPQYLLLGKGYSVNAAELALVSGGLRRTTMDSAETAILVGDYHNGPLSLIIPLGIFGVVAFLWFLWAGLRVLVNNLRHGDAELAQINSFLLAYFVARVLFFLIFFGSFYNEVMLLTGLVGLSVSINGGVRQPAPVVVEKPAFNQFRLARAGQ